MVLRVLLGFLMLTALIAIIDVWTDIDADGKVLLSSLVLSVAGVLALPGAAALDRNKKSPTGLATFMLGTLAALTTLWLIWLEPQDADFLSRLVASAWLWSLTVSLHAWIGQAILPPRSMWVQIAAPTVTYTAGLLATLAIYEVLKFEDWVMYLTATLYILAGLANLAVLIMHMMVRTERGLNQQLVLDEDGDDWCDLRSGRRYRISEA